MSDEFLNEYVLDANEQLAALNDSLLRLENNPHDTDAINRIFRAAHTLKGNSATMGFMNVSSLAHKVENVLDEVRHGKLRITGEIIDTLFEALDGLQTMVEAVLKGGSPKDCSKISAKLDSVFESTREGKGRMETKAEVRERAKPSSNARTYRIRVALSKETPLKSVRAFMVLRNMDSLGKIIKSEPDIKGIEEGRFEDAFVLHLSTNASMGEIESQIKKVSNVERCELSEESGEKERSPEEPQIKEVQSIRVATGKLDSLVNLVGELVINKSRLSQIAREIEHEPLNNTLALLERLTRDLQDLSMSMRMVKAAHVFEKFPRMVRDLAKKEGKDVEFIVEGKEIEMDRTVLDRLGDPLVHLLRNCIDHGIEPPEERERAGKPKKGIIKLSALRIKDHVEIVVEDDGRGIDPEELKEVAVRKGFLTSEEAEKLGEEELIALIFKPGFSGAKKVTDVSGRGVGLDVVKTSVSRLGGSVHVSSRKGAGTTFTLKLPISLAIIKALLVKINEDVYAIPTKDVLEVMSFEDFHIRMVKGREAIVHRGEPLPVLKLGEILGSSNGNDAKNQELVVVEKANKKIGLGVERILRQEEVVIKPLGEGLSDIPGVAGATILGDGRVALILDIYSLV